MTTMPTTLVLISHPVLENSKIHSALRSLSIEQGFDIRHIDRVIENGVIDAVAEQQLLEHYDTFILQFPLYWYSVPSALKQYLDDVLTSDWAYENRYALEGKTLRVVVTTGGEESDYSHSGEVRFTLDELMAPLKATASFTHMTWGIPLYLYGVSQPSEQTVESALAKTRTHFG